MQEFQIYQIIQQRRKRKIDQSRRFSNRITRFILMTGIVGLVLLSMLFLFGAFAFANFIDQLPPTSTIETFFSETDGLLHQPTVILDQTGEITLYTFQLPDIEREYISISGEDSISQYVVEFTVSQQHPDFWTKSGSNWTQWKSNVPLTIPEQLTNELLLWQISNQNIFALKLLTTQLMIQYGHEQILEWYLNSVYYGHLAYGIEQASQLYLGKSAAELNLAEAALLVSTAQYPALNPLDAPVAALENKDLFLEKLLLADTITDEEYQQALNTPIRLTINVEETPMLAEDFTQTVINTLTNEIPLRQLERGGYIITTTLDTEIQHQMECSAAVQLDRIGAETTISPEALAECEAARLLSPLPPGEDVDPQNFLISAIITDPTNGQVLAYLDQYTLDDEIELPVLNKEPTGLLSPFVALADFIQGAGPASLHWDITPQKNSIISQYLSDETEYDGPMRARMALANNKSTLIANLLEELEESNVFALMTRMGWMSLQTQAPDAGILFTGGDTNLFEVASAYNVFATLGTQHGTLTTNSENLVPQLILSVESQQLEHTSLQAASPETRSLLSAPLAFLIHDILADEISRRPSLGYPSPLSIGQPAAALIANNSDSSQSWTVGYTPDRLGVIWIGTVNDQVLDYRYSAGLWHGLMQYETQNRTNHGWVVPDGITQVIVCDPSGQLPTEDCPNRVTELFLTGNEPASHDTLYQSFEINRETGLLATVFTPLELIEEETFMIVPPEALDWAEASGLSAPPTSYDVVQVPPEKPDIHITTPENFSYLSGVVEIIGSAPSESFSSYRLQVGQGLNPETWHQIGEEHSERVRKGVLETWDTTGFEGLYALQLIVQRNSREIETATIQITIDNTPPTTAYLSPLPDAEYQLNREGQLNFQVRPEDNIGISQVQWWVDDQLLGQRTQAPYSVFIDLEAGEYVLIVQTFDLAGNITRSEDIHFSVE
ncbi:MAG: transglycosylase domain-containing protein [Anaerolineaceae bacterium]|nr:transglycosylase domain-containing protein [Anaerolineaceae bacterium]